MSDIDYDEERSTDGSDTEGSLVDFIVKDDGEEEGRGGERGGRESPRPRRRGERPVERPSRPGRIGAGGRWLPTVHPKRKATVRFEDEMANDKEYQHTMKKFAQDADSLSEDDDEVATGAEEEGRRLRGRGGLGDGERRLRLGGSGATVFFFGPVW